jgi:hypothetical protein
MTVSAGAAAAADTQSRQSVLATDAFAAARAADWAATTPRTGRASKEQFTMTYPDIFAALVRERSATVQAEAKAARWTVRRVNPMTATAAGLAATAYPEVAAAPCAVVITPGGRGYHGSLRSWGWRC